MHDMSIWEQGADRLIGLVKQALDLREWRKGSTLLKTERPGFDDRAWAVCKASEAGCTAEGPKTFRHRLELPRMIEGIPIDGAAVGVRFLIPTAMELFLDGRRIYAHRFWADQRATQVPLFAATPDAGHVLTLKAPAGPIGFSMALSIPPVEERLFELTCMREQLRLARHLVKDRPDPVLRDALEDALAILSASHLESRDWGRVLDEIRNAEGALEAFRKPAREIHLHLVGHAHLDMNWLWTNDDTVDTAIRDARTVTALMNEHPDLTCSQSQAHILHLLESRNPRLFRDIRRRIAEGRFEVLANTWVEGDLNLVEGESLVRQMLLARDYTQRKFGVRSGVLWEPDTFGHPATIPTLMADAGIGSYYFVRCGKGLPVFRWRGLDGSEVIACDSWPSYGAEIKPEIVIPRLIRYRERSALSRMMFVHGLGDHGGGPTREDIARKRAMERKPVMPEMIFSTVHAFFDAIRGARLPVVEAELNPTYEGCYTTHGDIKKANRDCQRALLALETLDAVARLRSRPAPGDDRTSLWRDALFNQFHDILDGCAIRGSYDYSMQVARRVLDRAGARTTRMMQALTTRSASSVTVFNPVGWERDAPVEHPAPRGMTEGVHVVRDDAGRAIRAECRHGRLRFTAVKLPAFGMRGYRIAGGPPLPVEPIAQHPGEFPQPQGWTFETARYSIVIDPRGGLIKKLRDKVLDRDVIASRDPWWDAEGWESEASGDVFRVHWETPHRMSAWLMGKIRHVETLLDAREVRWEAEALRTVISIRQMYRQSRLDRRIILYPDAPFVDFEADIDWREDGGPEAGVPVLRTGFYTAMSNPRAFFDIPFGSVERPTSRREYPALKWAALTDGDYWVALLNREKHGYHVDGSNLGLTLLRNAYEPDPRSDFGRQTVSYRLLFGQLDRLKLARAAAEYEMGAVVRPGRKPLENGGAPFQVEGDVVVTALKPALRGEAVALRLVEVKGVEADVAIRFNPRPNQVWRSNVMEERGRRMSVRRDGSVRFTVRPHSLTTVLLNY